MEAWWAVGTDGLDSAGDDRNPASPDIYILTVATILPTVLVYEVSIRACFWSSAEAIG